MGVCACVCIIHDCVLVCRYICINVLNGILLVHVYSTVYMIVICLLAAIFNQGVSSCVTHCEAIKKINLLNCLHKSKRVSSYFSFQKK